MYYVVLVALILVLGSIVGITGRTLNDRLSLMQRGKDIGPPWSGRCVSTRYVDLQCSAEQALQIAHAAIGTMKRNTGVVSDRNSWSVVGWTGTHLGARGLQISIFVTQLDPATVRLACYSRFRCRTTSFDPTGIGKRRADRLASKIRRLADSVAQTAT